MTSRSDDEIQLMYASNDTLFMAVLDKADPFLTNK